MLDFAEDQDTSKSRRDEEPEAAQAQHQAAMTKVLSQMTALLDHDDADVSTRAVEGFCKLYMTGHILSAKLFSKLLIMYFSPLTEGDLRLRAVLSNFLPQFAFMRASNQICVEESFMITLKHLINAPPDTHLSEIDLMKVIELLWQLTNPNNLIQQRRQGIARQTVRQFSFRFILIFVINQNLKKKLNNFKSDKKINVKNKTFLINLFLFLKNLASIYVTK